MIKLIQIALRNLSRQKKRSFILGSAIAFGFFIVIMADGLGAGAVASIRRQIVNMMGGQIVISGSIKDAGKTEDDEATLILTDGAFVDKTVDEAGIKADRVLLRTSSEGSLVFNGRRQAMYLRGVDFGREEYLRNALSFKDGSWEDVVSNVNSIMFSETAAEELRVLIGDTVMFTTRTINGKMTVGEFVVTGILAAQGPFGQIAAYVHKKALNELQGFSADASSECTLFFNDEQHIHEYADRLEAAFKEHAEVVSRAEAKQENPASPGQAMLKNLHKGIWEGTKYAVVTISDIIPMFDSQVFIVQMISLGFLAALFLVIMIGIANTFRIIMYERITEIGTMRAFGWSRRNVKRLFLIEATILSVLGAIVGLLLGIAGMMILSSFQFDPNNNFAVFQTNARWVWELSVTGVVLKFLLVIVLTLLAVRGIAKKASRLSPAEALRTTK